MEYTIFDIETNGLLPEVSKIHCLSYSTFIGKEKIASGSITDSEEIKSFVLSKELLVGHNIVK